MGCCIYWKITRPYGGSIRSCRRFFFAPRAHVNVVHVRTWKLTCARQLLREHGPRAHVELDMRTQIWSTCASRVPRAHVKLDVRTYRWLKCARRVKKNLRATVRRALILTAGIFCDETWHVQTLKEVQQQQLVILCMFIFVFFWWKIAELNHRVNKILGSSWRFLRNLWYCIISTV